MTEQLRGIQKQAAEPGRDSNDKFYALVEQSLIGVYIMGEGVIDYANPRLAEIFGYPVEKLIGSDPVQYIHPDDREMVRQKIRERLSGHVAQDRYELRIVRSDGAVRDAELHATRIEIEGKPTVVGTLLDITEQKKAEEWKSHLVAIVESSSDAIFTYDLSGRVLSWNPAAERLFGIRAEAIRGKSVEAIFPDDLRGELPLILSLVREGERLDRYETRRVGADGRIMDVSVTISPVRNSKGQIMAASSIARDVTRQKAAEKELEKSERLSTLGRVAATIAHEFNNVLMGIQPNAEIVERLTTDNRIKQAMDQIRACVRRGKTIAEDILRMSTPRAPALRRVPISEWLNTQLRGELLQAVGKNVNLKIETDDPGLHVLIDSDQMAQVLINLATNARDAMDRRGTLTIRVTRCHPGESFPFGIVPAPERFVRVAVSDTGSGINEATLAHIFEPMFTTKHTGTGLGLAVVHQIIQRHAGKIFVESEVGVGTTFHLFLAFGGETLEAQSRVSTAVRSRSAGPRRVVIVDDDLTVAAGLAEILALEGYEAHAVHTGQEVFGAIERFGPHLLLLDVNLPDVNGFAFHQEIAARYPSLPVIFSTGSTPDTQPRGTEILLKPYTTDEMLTVIERALSIGSGTEAA